MKPFKKKELDDYKKQLLRLRQDLTKQTKKDLKDGMESTRDDLKDIDDFAQSENDIDIWAISNNQKHDILLKIENAIERVNNKTYGYCEFCNEKIGEARLKAIPYTELCINCKEKEEQTKDELSSIYPTEELHDDDDDDNSRDDNREDSMD
ncbi:TraR/DksA family transcriptional regulator [Candidatus Poribacteria bacterium]|nr:TraR/DksA family transcriptional regulator [Candidatus Poribacteria bacterium]